MTSSPISVFPELKFREIPEQSPAKLVTKARILHATERLFIVHGFNATSLRAITGEAAVNLAAVNYHFGSKEELFALVLTQRLDALNIERERMLDSLEARGLNDAMAVEQLICAMFLPALRFARDAEKGGQDFLKFLGRAYADPSPFVRGLLAGRYAAQNLRFMTAFAGVLPGLARDDLSMRLHFMLDAISSTLASEDARKLMTTLAASNQATSDEDAKILTHLAPFLAASLRAEVNLAAQLRAVQEVIALV